MTDTPTATVHEHRLEGCTPTPLAGYLKALGVLRLLSTPENSATGEAADPTARGFWKNEAFHLQTRLDRESLLRFFLEDYAPSPIVAPWNKGSGFFLRKGDTPEVRDRSTEATKRVVRLSSAVAPRLSRLTNTIQAARDLLIELGYDIAPEERKQKGALMERCRALPDEGVADWLDAAAALARNGFHTAALLGSVGNDGNMEFSSAFHLSVLSVIDPQSGAPLPFSAASLEAAVSNNNSVISERTGLSQFSPGRTDAYNGSTGFRGESGEDPWSVILLAEGAMAFAGAATRRGEAQFSEKQKEGGSFPFTVTHKAAGSGSVALGDEATKRPNEIWLPLWTRPALYLELRALFAEGRANIGERAARDGLSFARAVATLGVNRGIDSFERVGFEARFGNMFITAPLGRFHTPRPGQTADDLIADLDRGDWLARVRSMARGGNAPARATAAFRRLEDALFLMTSANRREDGARAALMALGEVVDWMTHSKEAREKLSPPPRLRSAWVLEANDDSAEFRVAAALASLGWPDGTDPDASPGQATAAPDGDGAPPPHPPGEAIDGADEGDDGAAQDDRSPWFRWQKLANRLLPLAGHLAPLNLGSVYAGRRQWHDPKSPPTDKAGARYPSAEPLAVWGAGGLVRNMVAVLDRRLIEQAMRGLEDKPLAAAAPARLSDVLAFLTSPSFDDARCARLLAGLVWARPRPDWRSAETVKARAQRKLRLFRKEMGGGGIGPRVPFAYAALKPLFTPNRLLGLTGVLPPDARLPVPPGLVARLRAGQTDAAVRSALARARASGLASPFDPARLGKTRTLFGAGLEGDRLAAALLIPIRPEDLPLLRLRAYPKPEDDQETTDAA